MPEVFVWIEHHPGISMVITTLIVSFIGGVWYVIRKYLFKEQSGTQGPVIKAGGNISAGGDIIAGDKIIHKANVQSDKNFQHFQDLVETYDWTKESINHKEVYVCSKNNTYQMEVGDSSGDFSEKWTKVYPDSMGSRAYPVYLKVQGTIIKELPFVSCDGGRIFVPLPKVGMKGNEQIFYWERRSLEYKVGERIGDFYIYKSMGGIARMSKIEIR